MPPPNPHTSTRETWTAAMLAQPIDPDNSPQLTQYIEANRALFRLLAAHSAMRPNLQQTFMTPAILKTKIYFLWDFGFCNMLPHDLQYVHPNYTEMWADVQSRPFLTTTLLLDHDPGQLDRLVDATFPGQTGELPFGVSQACHLESLDGC
ncbi:hypothetical protein LTR53_015094 [Teratosphaeriaceae sp. CCFEE 6253]|nr:hypothetical protein LTR53_015094 [Teratosphaeriaceae sp. CCFEE 6253]